jgi:hypothetical protein
MFRNIRFQLIAHPAYRRRVFGCDFSTLGSRHCGVEPRQLPAGPLNESKPFRKRHAAGIFDEGEHGRCGHKSLFWFDAGAMVSPARSCQEITL